MERGKDLTMQYTMQMNSPLGRILLSANDAGITGLWFSGQKFYGYGLSAECIADRTPILDQGMRWLEAYFAGERPDYIPPLHICGTPFQKEVWDILSTIPYGKTVTYGEIAEMIARSRGGRKMSAQAVGGAVGRNPVSIIVPCHRVVGTNGSLTGYAGGIERKIALLKLEKCHEVSWLS